MIQQMDECGPPLCAADIQGLEESTGIRLPEGYKAFLLRYNGGRPRPNAFPIEGFANNPYGVIQVFFGINDPEESSNLDWNFNVFNGRLPADLFAIACDDGGDLICLSLFGDDVGSVLFWDFYDEQNEPSHANVYRIAEDFTTFIEGIRPLPD